MEKILIAASRKAMDDFCMRSSRYTVAFNRREEAFPRYMDQGTESIALLNRGNPPGVTTGTLPAQVKLWKPSVHQRPGIVHLELWLMDRCP